MLFFGKNAIPTTWELGRQLTGHSSPRIAADRGEGGLWIDGDMHDLRSASRLWSEASGAHPDKWCAPLRGEPRG
jgi:hypothetical protein